MNKVKVFCGEGRGWNVAEKELNAWLTKNPSKKIISIQSHIHDFGEYNDIIFVVHYQK